MSDPSCPAPRPCSPPACCLRQRHSPADRRQLQQSGTDLDDKASLQRGAALYMNNCSGCHSLKYVPLRADRRDLGLTEDQVHAEPQLHRRQIGDHVSLADDRGTGLGRVQQGAADLSVIARVRSSDWIYTYLKSFYLDESVRWAGTTSCSRTPRCRTRCGRCRACSSRCSAKKDVSGELPVEGFTISQGHPGTPSSSTRFRDITAFLEYAGEPAALKRQNIGVWDFCSPVFHFHGVVVEEGILAGRSLTRRHRARSTQERQRRSPASCGRRRCVRHCQVAGVS